MDILTFFVLAAAATTAWMLARGIVSMAHGGEADVRESHKLMFKRVGLQALTVLFLLLALLSNLK